MSFSVYLSSVFCFELLMLRAFLAVPYKNIYRGNKKHSKKKASRYTKPTSPPEKRAQWNTVKTPAGFDEFFFQWNTPTWILSKAPKTGIYLVPEVPVVLRFCVLNKWALFPFFFWGVAIFSSLSEFHFKGKIFPERQAGHPSTQSISRKLARWAPTSF